MYLKIHNLHLTLVYGTSLKFGYYTLLTYSLDVILWKFVKHMMSYDMIR